MLHRYDKDKLQILILQIISYRMKTALTQTSIKLTILTKPMKVLAELSLQQALVILS